MEEKIKESEEKGILEVDEKEEKELLKKLEAAMFLAARFLTLNELVRITGINPLMVRQFLEKLELKYRSENSAMHIIKKKLEDDGEEHFKMDVKPEFHKFVNKMATGEAEFSKAEQETLAIIAYKQPIKQSIVVKIRGNKAYDHVKHFMISGLVSGKKAGRTKELSLSNQFFNYFDINQDHEIVKKNRK